MRTATALLLAVCAATVCATLPLAAAGGRLDTQISWMALGAGVVVAAVYWFTSGPAGKPLEMGWGEWIATGVFAMFALRAFLWLIFWDDDGVSVLSPNNLGDMPLHLTFINFFAKGAKFWPESPIYSGTQLHYPAGIDIFNAMLKLIGCDNIRALIWVGLAGSALTCYALLRWGRWFGVMGFLCNGGLAGWKIFHHLNALRFEDYQDAMAWKSIPLSMFVTQRGLLYAIPAGVLLLSVWREQWFRAPDQPEPAVRMPLWVQVILYGTMPLFHLHTFLFLSALLAWWVILGSESRPRLRIEVLDLILWSILPGLVCVSLVTGLFQHGQSAAGMIHIKFGWMQEDHGFFPFWFGNFGILPLLALALLAWTVVRYQPDARARSAFAFVFPSLFVFGVSCVVMFASWEWDNMKIMIWAYLAVLPFLYEMLQRIPSWMGAVARPVCYAGLFLSGFVSLIGGLDASHSGYEIAKRSELDPVSQAVRFLPPDATFAGWPTYNHPLLLSGCKMVEGYNGHLYSYGIDYQPRLDKLESMMMGEEGWREIARELNVRYLFWGSREEDAYKGSTEPWKNLPVVASGDWGTIYDLNPDADVMPQPRSE